MLTLFFCKLYSLLFCLRYLPFRQAIRIPVLIHPSVRIEMYRGAIQFKGNVRSSMLVFGFSGTKGKGNCKSVLSINKGGKMLVGSDVTMCRGTCVVVSKGILSIGNNYCCNGDCFFNCTANITIGDDNICGWCTNFNTTDGHHVLVDGIQKPIDGNITIGNHVWIASYSHIAKNAHVADGCVVAQGSLVNKNFGQPHCLIGGVPAKVIKENVSWTAD